MRAPGVGRIMTQQWWQVYNSSGSGGDGESSRSMSSESLAASTFVSASERSSCLSLLDRLCGFVHVSIK
jgi:hypothetical protein